MINENKDCNWKEKETMTSSGSQDNRHSNSEQESGPRPEKDDSLLVRILDIPSSLFQCSEDKVGPMGSQQQQQQPQDDSPPPQQDAVPIPPTSLYQARDIANEVLSMIDNHHATSPQSIHDTGVLARVLQICPSLLVAEQQQDIISPSEDDETRALASSENWIIDFIDEALAVLEDATYE